MLISSKHLKDERNARYADGASGSLAQKCYPAECDAYEDIAKSRLMSGHGHPSAAKYSSYVIYWVNERLYKL